MQRVGMTVLIVLLMLLAVLPARLFAGVGDLDESVWLNLGIRYNQQWILADNDGDVEHIASADNNLNVFNYGYAVQCQWSEHEGSYLVNPRILVLDTQFQEIASVPCAEWPEPETRWFGSSQSINVTFQLAYDEVYLNPESLGSSPSLSYAVYQSREPDPDDLPTATLSPTYTPYEEFHQPLPPASCDMRYIQPSGYYDFDEAGSWSAWSWYGMSSDADGVHLPRWYFDDQGAVITGTHTFNNDNPLDGDILVLCPMGVGAPTRTPTPTTIPAQTCYILQSQVVTQMYDDDPYDGLPDHGDAEHNMFDFSSVPGFVGATEESTFQSGFPQVSFEFDAPVYYDPSAFDGWIVRLIGADGSFNLRGSYDYMNQSSGVNLINNDDGDVFYLEERQLDYNRTTLSFYVTGDVNTSRSLEICRADLPPVPARYDSCISGDLDLIPVGKFPDDGVFGYFATFEGMPGASRWGDNDLSGTTGWRAVSPEFAILHGDFDNWRLSVTGPSGGERVCVHRDYDSSIYAMQRLNCADPGGSKLVSNNTTHIIIGRDSDDSDLASTTWELCPPSGIATNTPTETPTNTPTATIQPTATPVPPVGCSVQPINQDITLDFASAMAVYRWLDVSVDYTRNNTDTGTLQAYGGSPLRTAIDDSVLFSPAAAAGAGLLLCPLAQATRTPTVTPTRNPFDDYRCQVLHSEWDIAESRHRINFADYGYDATEGGYRLTLDDHSFRMRPLDSMVEEVSYQPGGVTATIYVPEMQWRSYYFDGIIALEIGVQDGESRAFSIQLCDDGLPPPVTPSVTPTPRPTFTETPCVPCELRQTAVVAEPTEAAAMQTIIALNETIIAEMRITPNVMSETPVPTPAVAVRFDSTMYEVDEADGTVSVQVELSQPHTEDILVNYRTEPGSALAGLDYQALAGGLTFAAGELSKVIEIPIIDDLVGEPDELFGIVLTEVLGGRLGEYPASSVLIKNDDSAAITEEPTITPGCYPEEVYAPWTMVTLSEHREVTTVGVYAIYLTPAEAGEGSIWGYVATPFLNTIVPPGKYLAIPIDVETALDFLADRKVPANLGDLANLDSSVTMQLCPVLATPTPTATTYSYTSAISQTVSGACVVPHTPVPDVSGPMPVLSFQVPTMRPLPTVVTNTYVMSRALAVTNQITSAETAVAEWIEPAATMAAWSDTTYGPDPWSKGQQDGQELAQHVAAAFGWLSVFSMLGALSWLLPPIVISVLIRIAGAILHVMAYIREWIRR